MLEELGQEKSKYGMEDYFTLCFQDVKLNVV